MKILSPDDVVKPASSYAQGVVHAAGGERVVISGQLGVRPDGTLEDGLEAQMERAWSNVPTRFPKTNANKLRVLMKLSPKNQIR